MVQTIEGTEIVDTSQRRPPVEGTGVGSCGRRRGRRGGSRAGRRARGGARDGGGLWADRRRVQHRRLRTQGACLVHERLQGPLPLRDRRIFAVVLRAVVSHAHGLSPVVRLGRPDHGPARDDVPRRPRRGGGAAAARAHCDRPLGRACRRRALPDNGVSLRQPVRHADRCSFSRRDDVGDARHRADDTPHAAVMAGHRRCRSAHRIGHRHTHRRYHHPRLSVRSHASVRRGILDPAWIAAALPAADRCALRGRRRPRLGHGDRALAMAADRQSVGAVQGRAGALCDHPDVV